jgi:hypothetical protein
MQPTELEGRLGERLGRALALTRAISDAEFLESKDRSHLLAMLETELRGALDDMEATHA